MRWSAPLALLALSCTASEPSPPPDTDPAPTVGCVPPSAPAPPACGSGPLPRGGLIPGPADPAHDPTLEATAHDRDRLFHAVAAHSTGVNTEVTVGADPAARAALNDLLASDAWDLRSATNQAPEELFAWQKAAGAYAGVGIAADAYRYGALRDEGAPCEDVERARNLLLRSLDGLHRAVAITGTPGVIARGYASTAVQGAGLTVTPVPLFDEAGAPLPEEKDNGTWREDASGEYPDYRWEDSCSRDQYIGWVAGFGAAWEVIVHDRSVPDAVRTTLRADALALLTSLMKVQDSGYDLEIMDADGRRTYHGILHEQSIDRTYAPGVYNAPNALMSLGIVATLATVAGDEASDAWLHDQLLGERDLAGLVSRSAAQIDFGFASNYSGHNMAFLGGILAQRYLCDPAARDLVRTAVIEQMYDISGRDRQPIEQGQALYDLAADLAATGGSAWTAPTEPTHPAAHAAMLTTLRAFPDVLHYDSEHINCDEAEIAAGVCVAVDGSTLTLADRLGRGDELVAAHGLPIRVRPPSNYYWRSNPYAVNGGGNGETWLPGVDFRYVYWLGRWAEVD
jgi:hypothetical protein